MRTVAALLLAAAVLAGCRTTERIADTLDSRTNEGPCPVIGSVYDAARYVKFAPGSKETYNDIEFTGEIVDVRLFCRYAGSDPLVSSVEIDFAFGKGAKASTAGHTYPFFVAVTRRNGKVLGKQSFATNAAFKSGRVDERTEKIARVEIPRADQSISGVNFEVVVGFELTPEQLKFNRDGLRFRFDAEK